MRDRQQLFYILAIESVDTFDVGPFMRFFVLQSRFKLTTVCLSVFVK